MEPLTLKQRLPDERTEEETCWDDDFEDLDDIQIRSASTATSVVSHPQQHHRDSISSRMSMRSDSNQGDENWDVVVDEQAPIKDAIALAKSKGIPLPSNLPRSALEGGTIRRLKGKEIKKAFADDWSEDIVLPSPSASLKLARHEDNDLSESLRQISAAFHSSPKSPDSSVDLGATTIRSPKARSAAGPISLDAFKDKDEEDDFVEVPTIRVAKQRSPAKPTLFTPAPVAKPDSENLEEGLELPSDGQLKLSTRKPQPRTPQQNDDFDFEWGEGSLGTRNAGRGRSRRSARSSSTSALSPSVSSAFTAESEDEGLDGLVLPDGPIKFEAKLKKRLSIQEKEAASPLVLQRPSTAPEEEDFGKDFEIGERDDVFDSRKLTLNRNIKQKTQRPPSPQKRTTTTLNFTSNKTQGVPVSRLPRFQTTNHERARSNLEPVSETGAAVSRFQRPGSRLGLHSAQSSVSAIPTPSTPAPSTPSRRGLRNADSRNEMRYDAPTTTNAQLLRAKRSMPVMRGLNSPTKPTSYNRPPSRQDAGSRLNFSFDRSESRLGEARKPPPPFLPAGSTAGQSQHISVKTSTMTSTKGHFRQTGSDGSGDSMSAAQRSLSRIAGLSAQTGRPETPGRGRSGMTAAELAAQAKKQVTKPTRRRNYGDGTELEIFDDLPTSASIEKKFEKIPLSRGAPRSLRSKLGLGLQQYNHSTSSLATTLRAGTETPVPITPLTPAYSDFPTTATTMFNANVPRFARDTAASRNAREQRQFSNAFQNMHGEPLQPISTNFKLQNPTSARPNTTGSYNVLRKKKNVQQKPHLIKPMGPDHNRAKTEKGMHYNPLLFRWEGNENALAPFDVPPPDFYPRNHSPVALAHADHERRLQGSPVGTGREKVALISNMGMGGGVQVVGGMVFDPSRMKWLKMKEDQRPGGKAGEVELEEEEDVFKGLDDLKEDEDKRSISVRASGFGSVGQQQYGLGVDESGNFGGVERKASFGSQGSGNKSDSDEYGYGGGVVAEEFDVGPEFVRRQRGEEERWRRKVEKWLRSKEECEAEEEDVYGRGGWRWGIRELVVGGEVV